MTMLGEVKLREPTVADVIAELSKLPGDAPFRIEDADTSWMIPVFKIEHYPEGVCLSADYGDMTPKWWTKYEVSA